ncbi:Putative Mg2+ transporter protein, CorA-like/Zinc transport protein ZntB [Septoria linicola]|uniref:Mg2+ transporter protein, CorA-like/Zinc transport protein ZntB n=1 Tax=Septoria linicola TaxID=215465 RepID=A0A9Q9AM03_9PEZI|nr:putative Mg2+ transporter protein, CorA-like/Zinc transport protein ZntB [Septoria linicola]USW51907.1 Putative Mg2+ transporter protein, CorA-like/Zinc transport protein ZntB [Septoria linicola]
MSDPKDVDALLRQLDAHRDAYMATFQQMHDLLARQLAASATNPSGPILPQSPTNANVKARALGREHRPRLSFSLSDARKSSLGLAAIPASTASRNTGEDSDDDDCDYALYVHEPLRKQMYDDDGLRKHLMSHDWQNGSKDILDGITAVFLGLWNAIRQVNPANREHQAVGRITVVRDPSPMLFGAIHLTHHATFDVDQIFDLLVEPGVSKAKFNGAYHEDERQQRSFVFSLEYYTLIGEGCKPMHWQKADLQEKENSYDIRITRCSSIVALSLSGEHIKRVNNHQRRARTKHGFAYDPFAAWQVLNVGAYPDLKSSGDVHDPSKHYVNGVEAFLITLLGEFRDAHKRYEHIMEEIARITRPPDDFMFDLKVRDKLQFEDEEYTFSRRYFWAYQTLGTMNSSIKAMVDAYEDTFVEDVWEGKHKTIWSILDEANPRSPYYRTRMYSLKKKFEREISRFKTLMREIREHREEVVGLREELFVGTSIHESRNSVKNTEITIQQGHNIKLLTLVSIFFLPLTFVTSVFGMTNMPEERQYWHFGIVTATVCVPFFILIGSLNTVRGMTFWRKKTRNGVQHALDAVAWIRGRPRKRATK